MNRRTKIIVSVAGIFIVLLALLGLTYGYFLTRINGNSNEKSVDLATANLELTYDDGSGEVIGQGQIIQPGFTATKTFAVTNSGNGTVNYVVVLENVVNTFSRQQDVVYSLTCGSTDDNQCIGAENRQFPGSPTAIMVGNSIKKGVTHNYTLTVTYKETGEDQSADMNERISAKVNIKNATATSVENPYTEGTLAYNIINNAKLNKNGTELLATPKTTPGKESTNKYSSVASESASESSITISPTYQGYYWTYGTGYKVDEDTGKFTLTGVSTCKYSDNGCRSKLKGNYILSSSPSSSSSSTNTKITTTNLSYVYKVTEAPASSSSNIIMKAHQLSSVPYSAESTLSIAEDDYGYTYYYRGLPEDNFINFSGMCWRIVRIDGKGNIKIALADYAHECDSIEYSTENYSGTLPIDAADENWYVGFIYNSDFSDPYYYNSNVESVLYSWLYGGEYTYYWYYVDSIYHDGSNQSYYDEVIDDSKLAEIEWCNDTSISGYRYYDSNFRETQDANQAIYTDTLYGAHERVEKGTPSFKCNFEGLDDSTASKVNSKIGLLTADEFMYAGFANNKKENHFLLKNADYDWTMSPGYKDGEVNEMHQYYNYKWNSYGLVADDYDAIDGNGADIRPVVALKSGTIVLSGDGTQSNPYVIN